MTILRTVRMPLGRKQGNSIHKKLNNKVRFHIVGSGLCPDPERFKQVLLNVPIKDRALDRRKAYSKFYQNNELNHPEGVKHRQKTELCEQQKHPQSKITVKLKSVLAPEPLIMALYRKAS